MFSKYIHKFKFMVDGILYEGTVENDISNKEFKDAANRLKDKIFNQIGLAVIDVETQERIDDSNRNKIEYRTDRTNVFSSKCVSSDERERCKS